MKIAMINGQNHKGSTYHIGKMLADKLGGEVTEFFLPKDFGHFCIGCNQCIVKDEKLCPYYKELKPLTDAIDSADVIIYAGSLVNPQLLYFYCSRCRNKMDQQRYGGQYVFLGNGKDIQVRYCRSCHKL